ncbi:MAG: hypothetical protein JXR07_10755 [Reichenbachiella sp.]
MKTKLILALFLSVLASPALIAQENITKTIRTEIKKRNPSFKEKEFNKMSWEYWITGTADNQYGKKIPIRIYYSPEGQWLEDRWDFVSNHPEEVQPIIENNGGSNKLSKVSFVKSPSSSPYFSVEFNSGKRILTNVEYKKLPYGPLAVEGMLSEKIQADIKNRLKNPYIVKGQVDKNNDYQFFMDFQTDEENYQAGNITYSKEGEWIQTSYDLLDYDKLPLELMMHVMDNGGVEKFQNIVCIFRTTETVYEVIFNDGVKHILNEDFKKMNNPSKTKRIGG